MAGTLVALTLGALGSPAAAHDPTVHADAGPGLPPCTCRADGRDFQMGEVVCLRTNQGPRLARCVMVLNNTSWETIQQSCPSAQLSYSPRPRG